MRAATSRQVVDLEARPGERGGRQVRFLRSTIVPADEAFLCLVEAASEEAVRDAYARAGIPFELDRDRSSATCIPPLYRD
jgi:hypothetical protein